MNYKISKHAFDVIEARSIQLSWIEQTLDKPSLKVVVNPINMIVVTAYFDRNMRKKGCR